MGEYLAARQDGMAMLPHSMAIGAMLFVLITLPGPASGAHFDPAVTLARLLRREIGRVEAASCQYRRLPVRFLASSSRT